MKRMLALVFVMCLLGNTLVLATGIANPISIYDSLDEINLLAGTQLRHPAVMGVTDESFSAIDCGEYVIAQYQFSINGYLYTFRGASALQDISGVYLGAENAFDDSYTDQIEYAAGEGLKLARWFTGNIQYTVCLEDPDGIMDEETYHLIAEEFMSYTEPDATEEDLEALAVPMGEYQDRISERAWLIASANGMGGVAIEVHWANSAFEYVKWTLNAFDAGEGRLEYDDCTARVITSNDDGSETTAIVYEKASGYFSYKDGVLCWDGAEDESCRECEFLKSEY